MLKKSIAVLTAVAAIASASSVFAADYADQVVKLTDSEKAETLTDATAQYTVVIVDKKTGNEAVTLSADDLYYINQGTSADTFWTNMGTKTALTAGKTYTIRIGSNIENFTVKEYDFTVANGKITIKLGDCYDLNGTIDSNDLMTLVGQILGNVNLTGYYKIAANANNDAEGKIDSNDLMAVVGDILGNATLPTIEVNKIE